MIFRLDPPSGHADSYLDIRFSVSFDKCDRAEVRLFNDTIGSELEILAVSQGFIVDGKIATVKNLSSVEGFINIFNRDNMNSMLGNYTSVNIRCEATTYTDNDKVIESATETFYNESKSIDSGVLPFDLMIHNPEIDMKQNQPLKMSIVSTEAKFFELSFMDEHQTKRCTFDIFAKKGRTDFSLPSEILYEDLDIESSMADRSKFDLFWTKFEGVDYSKFVNRKRIKIPSSKITIIGNHLMPSPQSRNGPIGELSSEFVLSDRYFVHTHKDFSEFGSKDFNSIKMKRLTFFYYESIDMNDRKILPEDNAVGIRASYKDSAIKTFGASKQNFLTMFSPVFEKRMAAASSKIEPMQTTKKTSGCAGCGRKKR